MLCYLRYYIKQIIPHFESFLLYGKFHRNFLTKQKALYGCAAHGEEISCFFEIFRGTCSERCTNFLP